MGITRKTSGGGGGGGTPSALQAVKIRYDVAIDGGANASTISLHTFAAGTFVHSACMVQVAALVKGAGDPPQLTMGITGPADLVSATSYNAGSWAAAYAVLVQSGFYLSASTDLTIHIDESNDVGVVSGQYDIIIFYFTPASL